ncbi:MAG TPA: hypothetical protein VF883_04575 [Thermoanaerobaculia bacterium]|jgi:hypothetical protein
MKSFKLSLVLSLFSLLAAGSAMAVTIPKIDGYIIYGGTYSSYVYGARVRICTTPNPTSSSNCVAPITNSSGYYAVYNWVVGDNATIYWFPYTDSPAGGRTGRWGNATTAIRSSIACQSKNQYGWCTNYGVNATLAVYPSPLEPVAVNPAPNSTDVGRVQTMKWTNSVDSWRAGHDIVYDVYGSGFDAPLLLQVSNLPCNADANNRCQWQLPLTLDPQTPYNWKIVARNRSVYNYETESQVYHFTTGW